MADRKKPKKSPAAKTAKKKRTAKPAIRRTGTRKINSRVPAKMMSEKRVADDSEARFRDFFNYSPVSLWEEDISELLAYIARLRSKGITDLGEYFERYPKEVSKCASLVRVVAVNNATLEMYEASDQEELMAGLSGVFTEKSFDTFRDIVLALADEARIYECETINRTLTGKTINVLLKWSRMDGDVRERSRVLLSAVDITERKRAGELLRKSRENLKRAEKIARIGNWEWNIVTNELVWSDEVYRMYGMDPAGDAPSFDIVIKTVAPEYRKQFLKAVENAVRDDEPFEGEYRMIGLDGEERFTYTSGEVIRGLNGRPLSMFGIVQDITERKRAVEALHASEELLDSLVESSADAIFVKDMRGIYILINEAGSRLIGKRPDDILGQTDKELFPPDNAAMMMAQDKGIIETGKAIMYEHTIMLAGGPRTMQVRKGPVRDHQKRVIGVYGISRDITERRRAEAAISHSHELMQYVITHAQSAIAVHDRDLKYIYVSEQYLRQYKVKETDVIGKHYYDVFPDLPQKWRDVHQRVLAGAVEGKDEDPYVREDGSMDWTRWECRPWYEQDGSIGGLIVYTEVITERKSREEALLESEQRFRAAFENAAVGATIVDLNGRFIRVNRVLCKLLGYTEEELLKKTFSDVTHPDDVEIGVDYLKRMIKGELEFASFEKRYLRKDGSIVHFIISPSIIRDESGTSKYFVGLYQDITERKKAEDELRTNEEKYRFFLEHANDAVLIHSFEEDGLPGPFGEVSDLTCTWTGYAREELMRMTPMELDDPMHQEHILRVIEKLKTVGHAVFETVWVKKDGGRVPVEVSTRTMKIRDRSYIVSLARDTTERKKVEEALRKREKQLAESQRIAHIGSWEHNLKTGEVFWSDELFRLLGLDPEKDPGDFKMFFEMIHPDDKPMVKAAIDETVRNKTPFNVNYRFNFRDGKTGIIHAQAELIQDDDGDFVVLSGTAQDITQQKLAEQRLRESEDRFRSIFEHATDGIMIGDIEQKRHIEANRAICDMLGYSHDELINLRVEDIHPEEDLPRVLDLFERQARGETSMGLDIPMLRKDGSVLYTDINSAQISLGGKKYLVGIFRDITERKKTEEKIRQSEEFIRSILDTVDEGFIVIDRDYRIVTANKAYCDQVGCTNDKVIGMPCYMISHRNSRPCFEEGEECAVRHAFDTGEPHVALHKHPDNGDILYVETKAYPLKDASGTVTSVIETINNITEKHLLEEERLKTQKLESIGTLAGGIAHDFNNLLQGIFGYISMARMSVDREKSLSMLEQAEKALQQTVNLTTQLLTFSKGGQPVMKVIDLRPVIENATAFALSGTSSDCSIALDPELWCAVADEGQISQVIQNIVLNASQAMPVGGSVAIAARNIAAEDPYLPSSLAVREYVAIEIKDNGIGIPEHYLGKIFDPYFSTKEKGSGLGLATTYSIMKRHGGTITVVSSPGKGSSFTMYIPAAEAEALAHDKPVRTAPTGEARILVMDDEEIVREVAAELLKALGYKAEFAGHGNEALSMYQNARAAGRSFDIVILDLTIRGGMGGLETMRKLIEVDPDVRAVVSSGYSDDAVVAKYENHGFKAFLKKPYNFDELRETLYSLL